MIFKQGHPCRSTLLAAWLLATFGLAPAWASTPQVWRCDSAGQVIYADQPCAKLLPGAQVLDSVQRSVAAADPRSTQQQREAQAAAQSDERLLKQLQQERRQREREATRPAGPVIIGLPPDPLAKPIVKATSAPAPQHRRADRSGARTSPAAELSSRRGPG